MAYLNCNYVCSVYISSGGLAHFQNKNLLITYSPPCHPRCSCLSFFSRKEITWRKWRNSGLQWRPTGWSFLKIKKKRIYFLTTNACLAHQKSPLYRDLSWNVFLKNLNFFSTVERQTWTSWMTGGWVNYQDIFILEVNKSFNAWTTKCDDLLAFSNKLFTGMKSCVYGGTKNVLFYLRIYYFLCPAILS